MANKLRNEVEITLAGVKRTMRADFEAMVAIENELNTNIVALITKFSRMDMGVGDAAAVIFYGLKSADSLDAMTMAEVGNAVMEEGLNNVMGTAVNFLRMALQGVRLGKSKETAES